MNLLKNLFQNYFQVNSVCTLYCYPWTTGLVKVCLLGQRLPTWRDLWDSTEQMLKTQTPQLNWKCQAKSFTDLINPVFPLADKKKKISGADTGFLCFSKAITLNCPSLLCSIGNQTSCRTQLPSVFQSRLKGLAKLYKALSLDNKAHWFFSPGYSAQYWWHCVLIFWNTEASFFLGQSFKHLRVEEIKNKTRTIFLSYPFWVTPGGDISVHLFLFTVREIHIATFGPAGEGHHFHSHGSYLEIFLLKWLCCEREPPPAGPCIWTFDLLLVMLLSNIVDLWEAGLTGGSESLGGRPWG